MRDVIELNVLTPDEWSQWRDLRLRALAEAPYAFGARIEDWQGADEARWRQRLSLPGSCNLIARLGGRPVGMASGVPTEEVGAAELISMWVAPDARGRGVGDALITAAVRWASEHGARELRLDVAAGNTSAITLYARHGFVDRGPSRELDERVMVKVLGSVVGQPAGAGGKL
jgi:ribosomal protein S18 acetylase RimI-like enzyme